MIYIIFLSINALLAVALILLILLNRGRGANAGAAFGGGASSTVFGSRGATSFLTRTISVLSVVFFINTLVLAFVANRDFSQQGLLHQVEQEAASNADMNDDDNGDYDDNDNGTMRDTPTDEERSGDIPQ